MDDFLNPDFMGTDFGELVDYSQFESTGMWYISLSIFLNKNKIKQFLGGGFEETAYRY